MPKMRSHRQRTSLPMPKRKRRKSCSRLARSLTVAAASLKARKIPSEKAKSKFQKPMMRSPTDGALSTKRGGSTATEKRRSTRRRKSLRKRRKPLPQKSRLLHPPGRLCPPPSSLQSLRKRKMRFSLPKVSLPPGKPSLTKRVKR